MWLYDYCQPCERYRFFVKKRTYDFVKRDNNGKILVKEHLQSKNKLCGSCYKNIKKMLDK